VAEEQFDFIGDSILVAVLGGDGVKARRQIGRFSLLCEQDACLAKAVAERVMGELVEVLWVLPIAGQMARGAAIQVFGEEMVEMTI
jgi:hypothetical protein